jgi:uncharacterized RDD family membrane protein YckC
MNREQVSNSLPTVSETSKNQISLSFDDFEINAESFKPVTSGLGFHKDQKKASFKPMPQVKLEKANHKAPLNNILSTNELKIKNSGPSGLEAFYGTAATVREERTLEMEIGTKKISRKEKEASQGAQFSAWMIDLFIILSSVVITGAALGLASGIDFKLLAQLVTKQDLLIFGGTVFSIYYMLYFTILDLSNSPGKSMMRVKLSTTDGQSLSVQHTFTRSLVSVISIFIFCLPLLLDFQGRLSDTKIIK